MTNIIEELRELTETQQTSRAAAQAQYTKLFDEAVKNREELTRQKDAALASGDAEQYQSLKKQIEALAENIEAYQIGMKSKGSVKLTPEEVLGKVLTAMNEVNTYTAAEVSKIDQALDSIAQQIEALKETVSEQKDTVNRFAEEFGENKPFTGKYFDNGKYPYLSILEASKK